MQIWQMGRFGLRENHVNLSMHTARASHSLKTSSPQGDTESATFLLRTPLTSPFHALAHPLRSMRMARTSSLRQDDPPPPCASIRSPCVDHTYRVCSSHHMESSHVLHTSQEHARANWTPGAIAAVHRLPLDCSWSRVTTPMLTPSRNFDAYVGSLTAHLRDPHLTYRVCLFLTAHHRGFCPQQLAVL